MIFYIIPGAVGFSLLAFGGGGYPAVIGWIFLFVAFIMFTHKLDKES